MDALLEATGLSAAVLLQALLPLISEGGPLICSQPNEPLQGPTLTTHTHCCPSSSSSSSSLTHPPSALRCVAVKPAGGVSQSGGRP